MPTGNLTGWRQVFTEDFTSAVALGSWPGAYASKWADYTYAGSHDTNGGAEWNTVKDVSVSGGTADYYLHSENGQAYSAALLPRAAAQTYGRYQVRFKVDPGMTGWKSAWLLWPDDEIWPDHGEIDWPEGDLTDEMVGFMHYADPNGGQDWAPSNVAFASDWHTATTEWLPGSVKYYLDSTLVGTFTYKVSNYPMHWVLQSESASDSRPTGSGHIKIDWAVIYARA
jgi:beta-glucanase (GH16 family)